MSRIIDCPHCETPLTAIEIHWYYKLAVKVAAQMRIARMSGRANRVLYEGGEPQEARVPSDRRSVEDRTFHCPMCTKAIDLDAQNWHTRIYKLSNGLEIVEITDEVPLMEELL